LTIGDERYELTQFHFHRPSEELIHGKRFAMVAHLMHQDRSGHALGVAVLLDIGGANAGVQKVWDHMPQSEGLVEVAGVELDPSTFIPPDKDYYRYSGSQTAPPCQEGVTWIVLKAPVSVSAAQVQAFAKLYPRDVRPVQPANGRIVEESW
jgi:carbonic anhydrase